MTPEELRIRIATLDYFRRRYGKTDGECLIFTGSLVCGYGSTWRIKGLLQKRMRLSRLVLEIKLGRELGRFEFACHECDNPACFKEDHLWLGTPQSNIIDAANKGRMARGDCNGNSKVSLADARRILATPYRRGLYTDLAIELGVTRQLVSQIHRRVIWKWLEI